MMNRLPRPVYEIWVRGWGYFAEWPADIAERVEFAYQPVTGPPVRLIEFYRSESQGRPYDFRVTQEFPLCGVDVVVTGVVRKTERDEESGRDIRWWDVTIKPKEGNG